MNSNNGTPSVPPTLNVRDLWAETARAARVPNVIPLRPDPTPCPGDTYVFHHTIEAPIEWAIVERDPGDVRRLRVVPLDAYPQIGSHDLGLRLEEPGRLANIRCDLDAWLDASRFEQDHRTGVLPLEGLAAIRHKRDAIASGELQASLLEEKVDGDPEYRRWKDETLSTALAELTAVEERLADERTAESLPGPARPGAGPVMGRLYAVAASVVLVVGAFWSLRQMGDLRDQLLEKDRRVTAVTEELDRTKSSMGEQLAEVSRAFEQLRNDAALMASKGGDLSDDELEPEPLVANMAEVTEQLAESQSLVARLRQELAASPAAGVLANLPVSFLRGGRTRGEHRVDIPEGAPRVALVVEVIDPEPYERYRLEILDREKEGVQIWQSDQLLRRGSVLSLSLPSSLFDPGYYDLYLHGIDDEGAEKKLEESYLMHIRRVAGNR